MRLVGWTAWGLSCVLLGTWLWALVTDAPRPRGLRRIERKIEDGISWAVDEVVG